MERRSFIFPYLFPLFSGAIFFLPCLHSSSPSSWIISISIIFINFIPNLHQLHHPFLSFPSFSSFLSLPSRSALAYCHCCHWSQQHRSISVEEISSSSSPLLLFFLFCFSCWLHRIHKSSPLLLLRKLKSSCCCFASIISSVDCGGELSRWFLLLAVPAAAAASPCFRFSLFSLLDQLQHKSSSSAPLFFLADQPTAIVVTITIWMLSVVLCSCYPLLVTFIVPSALLAAWCLVCGGGLLS